MSPHPPPPHLTLDNFNIDSEVPEACPFVLTSPRSLEACRRTGVQVGLSLYHLVSPPCLSTLSLHLVSPPCLSTATQHPSSCLCRLHSSHLSITVNIHGDCFYRAILREPCQSQSTVPSLREHNNSSPQAVTVQP